MEKDEEGEEEPLPALVNHPQTPSVDPRFGLVGCGGDGADGVGPLKRLEAPALRLVALEVAGLHALVRERVVHVRVLGERQLAVREIEVRGAFGPVSGHWW